MDIKAMKKYVIEQLANQNDYSFMGDDYVKVAETLVDLEADYIASLVPNNDGDLEYDDDDAFTSVLAGIQERFSQYKMYSECLVNDYLDVSEKYLSENDDIEWE